jgi:ribosomal protein S18 acetylase RimI-like enzyme
MDAFRVRRAAALDRDDVLALLDAQLREHGSTLTPDAMARGLDGLLGRPERGAVLVGVLDRRVVGMAVLSSMWTLEHGGPAVWLDELYVEPAHRGIGIGEALLTAASEEARALGAHTVDLEVDEEHARAAGLYARHGFVRLPRTRWVRRLA